jgi:hypothetical protein
MTGARNQRAVPPGPGTSRICPVTAAEPASRALLLMIGEGCCDAITLPAKPERLWQENELMWDRLSSRSLNSPRQKSNIVWDGFPVRVLSPAGAQLS